MRVGIRLTGSAVLDVIRGTVDRSEFDIEPKRVIFASVGRLLVQ